MIQYRRPEPIGPDHDSSEFDCGSEEQTTWLRRHALQAHRSDAARVYVACRSPTNRVVGYYAIAAGSVAHEDAPPRVAKGLGRYPIPVVVLTRLGVDVSEQGRGLGTSLVRDALLQTAVVGERVAVRALIIHAESPDAAAFYQRISPAFLASPTDPLHVLLLMKDLRSAIAEHTHEDASEPAKPSIESAQPHGARSWTRDDIYAERLDRYDGRRSGPDERVVSGG